jgi:hypothetical protein
MFNATIQMKGLEFLSENRVSEGIELIADYIRVQKKHGSDGRLVKLLAMFEPYGAHAQRVIPELKDTADYFEFEDDYPKKLSVKKAEKVREAIEAIKARKNKPRLIELNLR